jgi:sulfite exporter TauE/SafE
MIDTVLAYLISLGIIGAGVTWIVAGTNSATSVLCITVGVLTIAVGLISLLTELRHGRY